MEEENKEVNKAETRYSENDKFFAEPFVAQQNEEQNLEQESLTNEEDKNQEFKNEYDHEVTNETGNELEMNNVSDKEEFATEVAAMERNPIADYEKNRAVEIEETRTAGNAFVGWLGLAIAIVSLFAWPGILGPAAALVGFYALTQGSRALGIWSIVIGLISFLAYIVLVPLYA